MSDAELVAQDLEISYDVIEIEPIIDTILSTYPEAEGDREAVGNARARVRAVLNYLVANHESRLVLGTGNRSEAAVGYFTKYGGDGAVDCHPIGNLYKGDRSASSPGTSAFPRNWPRRPPPQSCGPTRPTRASWGSATRHSTTSLATHIDGPLSVAATARLLEVDEETVERVRGMYERSEHKRNAPPAPEPLE